MTANCPAMRIIVCPWVADVIPARVTGGLALSFTVLKAIETYAESEVSDKSNV